MKISILNKTELNPRLQNQVSELFKQLSAKKKQLDLEEVLSPKNQITIAYCQENNKIIGIASMCTYRVISGFKGWIEDVVVDSNARGKGIGRQLMEKLLEVGKEKELSEILLFTEDERQPAINLYNSLGFKLKESRIYTLKSNE